jgi:hypothetical protein
VIAQARARLKFGKLNLRPAQFKALFGTDGRSYDNSPQRVPVIDEYGTVALVKSDNILANNRKQRRETAPQL